MRKIEADMTHLTREQSTDVNTMRRYATTLADLHITAQRLLERDDKARLSVVTGHADKWGNRADNLYDEMLDSYADSASGTRALWHCVTRHWFGLCCEYAIAIKDMAHEAGCLPPDVDL